MDTIIFLMLVAGLWTAIRSKRRGATLAWWALCLVASVLLFAYHVTDPLDLEF